MHPIAKLSALWLFLLILIPFTAPFRTIDLSGSPLSHQSDGIPKDKSDADGAILAAPAASYTPAIATITAPVSLRTACVLRTRFAVILRI